MKIKYQLPSANRHLNQPSFSVVVRALCLILATLVPLTFNEALNALAAHGADAPQSTVVISPSSAVFGDVAVGSTSPVLTFTAVNHTASPAAYLYYSGSDSFSIQPGTCHLVNGDPMLAPGATCSFTASFKPVVAGPVSGSMTLTTSNGPISFALSGTGVEQPGLVINPSSGVFGNVAVGTSSPIMSFTATNNTTSPARYVSNRGLEEFNVQPGNCHLVNGDPMLGPGQSCTFTAAFLPTSPGPASGSISITSSAGTLIVPLSGTGVSAIPPASNPGGPYTGATGVAVSFDGSKSTAPSGQMLSYAWSFGDGGTGTGVSPTHTYTAAGTYTVSLIVTASGGGTSKSSTTATITQTIPVAANPGGPYTGATGVPVSFDGSKSTAPSGQMLSYAWSFGDGGTGTGVSPTHTYTAAGTYTVSLIVTASGGGTSTASTTATITQTIPLAANAGGPYTGATGVPVSFDGSKSTAPSGQTLSYAWTFGDSSTGTGVSPTRTYTAPGTYKVSLTVTASGGGTSTASTTATITQTIPLAANPGGPYTGATGVPVSFDGSKSTAPSGQTLSYAWSFGDGGTGTGVSPTHTYTAAGTYTVSLIVTASGGGTSKASTTATITALATPTISGFSPASGPIGTVIAITGKNLASGNGSVPQITLDQQGGSTLAAPVSSSTTNSISFVIPPGAATGPITVSVGSQSVSSATPLTITTSSTFTVSVSPAKATLLPGQSAALAVTVNSANGFSGLATLSVKGLPAGVTGAFQPSSVAAGQVAVLSVTAPSSQAVGTSTLTVSASATVDGQSLSQSATASLKVTGITTSFLGRTVVDDAQNTPIAGVTVKFTGKDDKGNTTGCSGQTTSDGAGNFLLANLNAACVGPQLITYDGVTATAPAGKYAGVNLSYTLSSGQVTASPVLVHLPRIDDAETVQVQQNSPTDQVFSFNSMPGVQVTVYAGTVLKLDDGSTPNPFPLTAIAIPLDRLPEQIPTSGMLMSYVVAFQPANAESNQPVAVVYPNALSVASGTHVTLTTLDPTHGYMVPYGTATVSNDGRTVVPDLDPSHTGHRYGLVHFDWHTWLSLLLGTNNGSPDCRKCMTPTPVDISTGNETYTTTDLQVRGGRGSLAVERTYRSLDPNPGPFGIGTGFNYGYALDITQFLLGNGTIKMFMPDLDQYTLSIEPDSTFQNSTLPRLRGAVLTPNRAAGIYTLRYPDGTLYTFQVFSGGSAAGAYLTAITDLNGNTTTITLNPNQPRQVQRVTDPVGRSLNFVYDGSNRVTQITDPIGRIVKYAYNGQGTLQSFTDANGGVTSYTYDAGNNVLTITDPRGVVTETNTYNETGDQRVIQQVDANGGVTKFAYTLLNSIAATELISVAGGTSPILQTVVTDPRGNATTYRFDTAGFLQSATDPTGQTTTLTHDASHYNLITSYKGAGVCVVCNDRTQGDTSYTYDQFGNRLTSTDSLGHTTSYTYDSRFNKVNSITDALGHVTRLSYDSSGNLLLITDANGHQTQLAYDNLGDVTQVTDAAGATTAVAYDSFGNIVSVTDTLGHSTALSYDAISRLTQVQDALSRKSTASYDPLDRVTSQTDPLGHTTSFAYDPIGDLLSYTDARHNTVSYAYDSIGRVHTRTSQLGKSETYGYDANSNLTQYTDRRGQSSTFQYDPNNRLIQETYTDATVSRVYDSNGRLLTVNDSQGGQFDFAYDAAGRLLTQGEPTGIVKYSRDALGRVATRQVEGQAAVNYTYDPVGDMLTAASSAVGVSYQYDARNLPTTLTRTNGVVTNYSYDQLGQVLSIIHSKGVTALNTQKYTYDAVGNRSAISNDISQPLITQSATSTVDTANELLTNGGTTYTYDANGNRLTETTSTGTLTYVWDGRNRLSAIRNSNGNMTALQYDFTRNLLMLAQTSGATTTQQAFVVDSLTNVVSTAAAGSPVSLLTGSEIDSQFASVDSVGNAQFGITDGLNSVTEVTDSAGSLSNRLYYEPFGQTTGSPSSTYPFTFSGRIPVYTSIVYFRNRYYDTESSRFLSEDPLSDYTGSNNYSGFDDDPIDEVDPTGLVSGFVFGGGHKSLKHGSIGIPSIAEVEASIEAEGVAIGGFDFSTGCFFGGGIAAVGPEVGASVLGRGASAEQLLGAETIGGTTQTIKLTDASIKLKKIAGAGGGYYITGSGEEGVYAFVNLGKNFSFGGGFSLPEWVAAYLQGRQAKPAANSTPCGCGK